jgi:hypothetical protein
MEALRTVSISTAIVVWLIALLHAMTTTAIFHKHATTSIVRQSVWMKTAELIRVLSLLVVQSLSYARQLASTKVASFPRLTAAFQDSTLNFANKGSAMDFYHATLACNRILA